MPTARRAVSGARLPPAYCASRRAAPARQAPDAASAHDRRSAVETSVRVILRVRAFIESAEKARGALACRVLLSSKRPRALNLPYGFDGLGLKPRPASVSAATVAPPAATKSSASRALSIPAAPAVGTPPLTGVAAPSRSQAFAKIGRAHV